MQILFTPKEAEDYILNTAEQCKLTDQTGTYTKEKQSFDLHEEFHAQLKLTTVLNITESNYTAELTSELLFTGSPTPEERKKTAEGIQRELKHIIKRSFPGELNIRSESYSTEDSYKIVFKIIF